MPEHDGSQRVRTLHRRQLLWQGLVGAGALVAGPSALRALAANSSAVDLGPTVPVAFSLPVPQIITRAEWGADESLRSGTPDFAPLNRVIVHHTVTATDEPNPAGRIRTIHQFHTQGRGWSDIGYNFIVDGAGRIYEGRLARAYGVGEVHDGEDSSGRGVIGAHASGHNAGSVGIALLGTYTDGRISPTDAALDAVATLAAWKLGSRGIDPRAPGALIAHRDVVATGCPGDGCYNRLPEVRDRAFARTSSTASPDGGGLIENLLDLVVEAPDIPLL